MRGTCGAGPDSQALGACEAGATPRSSSHTSPAASRPAAVKNPGLRQSRLRVCRGARAECRASWSCVTTAKPGANCPVSASSPLGKSTARTGTGLCSRACRQATSRASGVRAGAVGEEDTPMPNKASIHRSMAVDGAGGWSSHCTPQACARCQEAMASAGAWSGWPSHVTNTWRPLRCSCIAASRPSPPLLPGPHAIHTVRAWGARAWAKRATATPARCIRVWRGNVAAAACSMQRVAADVNRG